MDHEILRGQIVAKLKKYEAYIDNELPDYIMVMLANKKTIQQINNDLQLFLGENTDTFTDWLQQYLEAEKQVTETGNGLGNMQREQGEVTAVPVVESIRTTPTGSKRQRGDVLEQKREKDERMLPNGGREESEGVPPKVQRVRLSSRGEEDGVKGPQQKHTSVEAKSDGRGRDLRELIAERRGPRRPSASAVDEEEEGERAGMSSVVKLVERPRGTSGTTRLLERAIKGISSSGGGGRSKQPSAKALPDNTVSQRTREKETKGRIEPEEQEDVEEGFVDEFRAEQQTEDDPAAVVPSSAAGVKGSEVVPVVTAEVKQTFVTAAVKQVSSSSTSVDVTPPVDLRELLNRTKETGKDTSTRFVVTMTGLEGKYPQLEPPTDAIKGAVPVEGTEEEPNDEEGVGAAAGKGGSLERCRFWPNCKNGDTCPYLHPTVPCRMFPNCKYGNKCHFVHPVCKFDSRCTRPDCSYLHTAPRKKVAQPPKLPAVVPLFKPSTFKPSYHSFSGVPWQRRQKFPTKSDLTWTPSKPHISERQFAVSEEQATHLSV